MVVLESRMNPASDYRHYLRRPSQRPDSAVRPAIRPVGRDERDQEDAADDSFAEGRLFAELAKARATISQLSVELCQERERRSVLEKAYEVEAREAKELLERELQAMSTSYHETLAALRRAYEQRIDKAELRAAEPQLRAAAQGRC